MSDTQKQKAIKANLFGQGFEGGRRTTIGCSYKGRIWSYQSTNLLQLTTWCRNIGRKLVDRSLDPDQVLSGTLVPELVTARPAKVPIAVDWPELFYKEPERCFSFTLQGERADLCDTSLALDSPSADGPLGFSLVSADRRSSFALALVERNGGPDFVIHNVNNSFASVIHRGRTTSVVDLFGEEPPTFWFADGSSLTGNEYVALRRRPEPFNRRRIEAWDWTGTNIRVESQGVSRDPAAIQFRVIQELRALSYGLIYDDDDHGESADVVAITEHPDRIEVEFWHCKFSSQDAPGHRLKDLYEVCGQAQKSIRWLDKPRDLFSHLLRRATRVRDGASYSRYQQGTEADLLRVREKSDMQRVLLRVAIVQPGLAKEEITDEQLELLAVTENYLMETYNVPFRIVVSD